MADDKGAAGGGSSWGPIEIILAIVLGIILLSYITGRPIVPLVSDAPSSKDSVIAEPELNNNCGLTVTKPRPLEKVTGSITVSGRITGCQWYASNGIALYAQAVDSRGRPVTSYTSVPALGVDGNAHASFSSVLRLTRTPAKGTGYVILIPATTNQDTPTGTSRIPVQFQ